MTNEEREFSERIDAHRRELLSYCVRMTRSPADSEDLVQETLLRAWRGPASLRNWLYRIATNVCRDAHHRRRRRPQPAGPPHVAPGEPSDWQELLPSPAAGPEEEVGYRETIEQALEAALRLPPRQRTVLIMRDVIGLSGRETAAILDVSKASADSALQRARAGLRSALPEEAIR